MHPAWAVEPAGPVAGRAGSARSAPRCYVCRARAIKFRSSGNRARTIIWPWIADSRLRRLSTHRQGLSRIGGAKIAAVYRVSAFSLCRTTRRHPPARGGKEPKQAVTDQPRGASPTQGAGASCACQ